MSKGKEVSVYRITGEMLKELLGLEYPVKTMQWDPKCEILSIFVTGGYKVAEGDMIPGLMLSLDTEKE